MYQTLEDLEYQMQHTKTFSFKKVLYELRIFFIIFLFVFCGTYFITNAQLMKDSFSDAVHHSSAKNSIIATLKGQTSEQMTLLKEKREEDIKNLISQYEGIVSNEKAPAEDIQKYLRSKLDSYDFEFNILPPTNRIISEWINLSAPIVEAELKDNGEAWVFSEELKNGVVKYPKSANPWEKGTVFLFWHTSQEYWEKNPYWTVFRNLPSLQKGNIVELVREGKLYNYEVVETVIVTPKKVNDTYLSYAHKDGEYLVLMGCYPIWRTDKRMMVFAKRVME